MAKILTSETFNSDVLESSEACLVDFYAPWCGPCKMMAPVLDELSQKYEGKMNIYKIDIDQSSDAAAKFGIMSIPTLMIFDNGKPVETLVGARPKEFLEEKIESFLSAKG